MANRIEIVDDGPMKLTGEFELRDDRGEAVGIRKVYMLCRCGLSARMPFCDASHKAAGFSSCPRAPQHSAGAVSGTQTN
jgi:CDGSH-type Zn-finger protein